MKTLNVLKSLGPSILFADHDPGLAEAVRRTLLSRGRAVRTCTSGLQCVELLKESSPSILVLDPELLWGGGEGVIDWLASDESLLPPMVVVARDAKTRPLPDCLDRWVDVHLQRPDSINHLLPFVNQLETLAWWSRSPQLEASTSAVKTPAVKPV